MECSFKFFNTNKFYRIIENRDLLHYYLAILIERGNNVICFSEEKQFLKPSLLKEMNFKADKKEMKPVVRLDTKYLENFNVNYFHHLANSTNHHIKLLHESDKAIKIEYSMPEMASTAISTTNKLNENILTDEKTISYETQQITTYSCQNTTAST
mmetsp:Transcript_30870/g.27303  ORF Transcript_30870/g.27303 Transcript_30870/m.27303 type:complete len:155 (+) Transcript_30870:6-470(+)